MELAGLEAATSWVRPEATVRARSRLFASPLNGAVCAPPTVKLDYDVLISSTGCDIDGIGVIAP